MPLVNLRVMASTMVGFIRDRNTISIDVIKDTHKSVKITKAGFRDLTIAYPDKVAEIKFLESELLQICHDWRR